MRNTFTTTVALAALALATAAAAPAVEPEPAPAPPAAADDADARRARAAERLFGVGPRDGEKQPLSPFEREAKRLLDKQHADWMKDPLRHLAGDMSGIVGDLEALRTGEPVQGKQSRVAGQLETLIKQLEKECAGGAGGGPNPTKPLGKSILAKGPGGVGEMHDPKAGEKQWASLPPKQREQILQSKTDGFPPGYESLLQSYYQRLAQEEVGSTPGEAAPDPGGAAPTDNRGKP